MKECFSTKWKNVLVLEKSKTQSDRQMKQFGSINKTNDLKPLKDQQVPSEIEDKNWNTIKKIQVKHFDLTNETTIYIEWKHWNNHPKKDQLNPLQVSRIIDGRCCPSHGGDVANDGVQLPKMMIWLMMPYKPPPPPTPTATQDIAIAAVVA